MAQVCVGNSRLERHCSKESAEQDQDKKAACSLEGARGEYTAVMQGWAEDWRIEKEQEIEIISQFQTRSAQHFRSEVCLFFLASVLSSY